MQWFPIYDLTLHRIYYAWCRKLHRPRSTCRSKDNYSLLRTYLWHLHPILCREHTHSFCWIHICTEYIVHCLLRSTHVQNTLYTLSAEIHTCTEYHVHTVCWDPLMSRIPCLYTLYPVCWDLQMYRITCTHCLLRSRHVQNTLYTLSSEIHTFTENPVHTVCWGPHMFRIPFAHCLLRSTHVQNTLYILSAEIHTLQNTLYTLSAEIHTCTENPVHTVCWDPHMYRISCTHC